MEGSAGTQVASATPASRESTSTATMDQVPAAGPTGASVPPGVMVQAKARQSPATSVKVLTRTVSGHSFWMKSSCSSSSSTVQIVSSRMIASRPLTSRWNSTGSVPRARTSWESVRPRAS